MSFIRSDNVTVEFPLYGGKSRSLKSTVLRAATGGKLAKDSADRLVIRALDSVNLELNDGDRIALVGHNGSGKSTLLRVLAEVYEPVTGSILIRGRVASMLSITVGMDYEATGYENIFIRGAIMGFSRKRMMPLVDDIVDFCELGDYLEMPVRTYSSGMYMRLAFAVATSVPADIILMDEWLSVGDESFAEKAERRLESMLRRAGILVMASHDAGLIHRHCNKVLRLNHGSVEGVERIPRTPEPTT
jgi:homopolymeric O-antigen transport system ATP-binding protein